MGNFLDMLLTLAMLYVGFKILVWLWKKVIVPTGKKLWKLSVILTTICFFAILFVLRDKIFNALPEGLQVLILLGMGAFFGVEYLKRKNRL